MAGAARRGIVLVTDGRSSGNRIGFAELLATVRQAGVPVYVVAVNVTGALVPDPAARLRQLASDSHGETFLVTRAAVGAGVARAMSALRSRR